MRHRTVADVHLLLVRDGRVLLGLRQNTGWGDGLWHIPAGHLDEDESLLAAAAREAFEELGLVLPQSAFTLAHLAHARYEDGGRLHHFFAVDARGQVPRNTEPAKCGGLAWFALDALPENIVAYAAAALAAIGRGETFTCPGW